MVYKRKGCLEWGFDLTDFPNYKDWARFLKRHRCKVDKTKMSVSPDTLKVFGQKYNQYAWKCNGITLITAHSGKKTKKRPDFDGFIGYVGVEFTPKSKKKWVKMRRDFVESASDIKDESECSRDYI